jgi:hypothetical protein
MAHPLRPTHVIDAKQLVKAMPTTKTAGKRDDFTSRFISHGTSGRLPCTGGERRILQLSASLAAGIPVSLRDAVTGLDNDNTVRLLAAIRHATGIRPSISGHR